MFIVNSYALAVILCFVTMLCWGSWANTQKLAAKSWRYELFYWDYVIGMLLFSLLVAFTAGSFGSEGRSFLQDLSQAAPENLGWVLLGAVVFNVSNILLSASTSIAGMSVAFPLGCGLALVLGVVNNLRVEAAQGALTSNIPVLAVGVALVVLAVVLNGIASGKKGDGGISKADQRKGILLALIAGIVMSFFSSFVMRAMDLTDFAAPAAGKITPYTAIVVFSLGVFLSNFIVNTIVMKKPFVGEPVSYGQYFSGNAKTHLVGMLGGAIWCLGTSLSYITAGKAGAAVSYALGQGAPMVAAIWGVFIWKEFKGARKSVYGLLAAMFVFFIAGLGLIIKSGDNDTAAPVQEDTRISVIFDTDANNELDDQHAIAYMLMNPETFNVLGITTNATHNGGDVENHSLEARRVVSLVGEYGKGVQVISGANANYLDIKDSLALESFDGCEGVNFIIDNARNFTPERKLVVIAVGKLTNLALALEKAPEIAANIRLVWLGSNYPAPGEYNLKDDIPSMNAVLDTDVEFELVTVRYHEATGTDAVRISRDTAVVLFAGKGPKVEPVEGRHGGEFTCFGDYSVNLFSNIKLKEDGTRALFDMAAVAVVKNPSFARGVEIPAPTMIEGEWVERPDNTRRILVWENFDKEAIISDFVKTICR